MYGGGVGNQGTFEHPGRRQRTRATSPLRASSRSLHSTPTCAPLCADIFSFGVLLWEICTGEAPSRGKMRPLLAPQECPAEVRDLQLACVRLSPQQRPSALQIVRAFHGLRRANTLTASTQLPAAGRGEASAAAAAATSQLPFAAGSDGGVEQQASPCAAAAEGPTAFATPFSSDRAQQAQQEGTQQQQEQHSVGEAMPAEAVQFLPLPSMNLDSPFNNVSVPSRRGETAVHTLQGVTLATVLLPGEHGSFWFRVRLALCCTVQWMELAGWRGQRQPGDMHRS